MNCYRCCNWRLQGCAELLDPALQSFEFTQFSAGAYHLLAVSKCGSLFGAGMNNCGQLGIVKPNTQYNGRSLHHVAISKSGCVISIAAGAQHSLFLYQETVKNHLYGNYLKCGTLWGMGDNSYGQLGFPSSHHTESTCLRYPTALQFQKSQKLLSPLIKPSKCDTPTLAPPVAAIAAGHEHSVLQLSSAKVITFGRGSDGQLGRNHTFVTISQALANRSTHNNELKVDCFFACSRCGYVFYFLFWTGLRYLHEFFFLPFILFINTICIITAFQSALKNPSALCFRQVVQQQQAVKIAAKQQRQEPKQRVVAVKNKASTHQNKFSSKMLLLQQKGLHKFSTISKTSISNKQTGFTTGGKNVGRAILRRPVKQTTTRVPQFVSTMETTNYRLQHQRNASAATKQPYQQGLSGLNQDLVGKDVMANRLFRSEPISRPIKRRIKVRNARAAQMVARARDAAFTDPVVKKARQHQQQNVDTKRKSTNKNAETFICKVCTNHISSDNNDSDKHERSTLVVVRLPQKCTDLGAPTIPV